MEAYAPPARLHLIMFLCGRPLCQLEEFEDLVQANLAANAGLNWHGFVDLLGCTVHRALGVLRQRRRVGAPHCAVAASDADAVMGMAAGPEAASALLTLHRAGQPWCHLLAAMSGCRELCKIRKRNLFDCLPQRRPLMHL